MTTPLLPNGNTNNNNDNNKDGSTSKMVDDIAEKTATFKPLDVEALRAPMFRTHETRINLTYSWRKDALLSMKRMLLENKDAFCEALRKDLGKHPVEAWLVEGNGPIDEVNFVLKRLRSWMQPTKVASPIHMTIGFSQVSRVPLAPPGVLVIGPSNYPLLLSLGPALGSLAAGNPTVMKPSDLTPATSGLLETLVPKYFDKSVLQVVCGGVDETTRLLQEPWGKICFTGSTRVGRIVAQAAAKTLTPTILELGGKSPAYVDKNLIHKSLVAHRIVWGKTINSGQTCIAIDYLMMHKDVADELLDKMVKSVEMQFGSDIKSSELGRMVQVGHAHRLVDMLKEVEASPTTRILCGGSDACNPDERFVAPTIVVNPPRNSRLMKEEIFGPILPVHIVDSDTAAKEMIQQMPATPLALYVFTTNNRVFRDFVDSIPSGTVCGNDSLVQFGSNRLPIAGIGTSGWGSHRGRFSFDAFSHTRGEVRRSLLTDLRFMRYHPFEGLKGKVVSFALQHFFDVPVLKPSLLMATAMVLLLSFVGPRNAMQVGAANALEGIASLLRP